MISQEDYEKLISKVNKKNGVMYIPKEQYKKANNFSNWYNILSRYTMESHFIKDFNELDKYFTENNQWFIKDNLKSLGGKNSIANSKEEAIKIYNQIQKNRDFEIIDNGICLREVIEMENEERFFALNGEIISNHTNEKRLNFATQIAKKLQEKLSLVFISIDIASSNDKNILVEVGGFQVSDINKSGDLVMIKDCYSKIKEKLIF